ncbi:MAG TPA: hypothetical protein VFZ65_16820 [Planctomycetota bacterium]|nr:hypothetical protein [Planctomycetota bacterium]
MKNLLTPRWMLVKAILFVLVAMLAAGTLIAQSPTYTTAACVLLVAWSSSRAYYFAFYVIEHYVDPTFRFSGLTAFAVWLWRGRKRSRG